MDDDDDANDVESRHLSGGHNTLANVLSSRWAKINCRSLTNFPQVQKFKQQEICIPLDHDTALWTSVVCQVCDLELMKTVQSLSTSIYGCFFLKRYLHVIRKN